MRPLLAVLFVTLATRVAPLMAWPNRPCVRDECTYRDLSGAILRGEGMLGTRGWLWAPGYPAIIAAHTGIFHRIDAVKWTQVAAALVTAALLFRLTQKMFGARAAVIAGLLFALSPTHVYYATTWLSECFYTAFLLGAVVAIGWAREGKGWGRGVGVGLLLGACVMFRGIATYLLPCLVLGLVWGRHRRQVAWKTAIAMAISAVVVVAPYSLYASEKFDAFVVSDRTLGQMMWLGNNDYSPITFDYGNGLIRDEVFEKTILTGRAHCPHLDRPADQDTCELANGVAWIQAHPAEFIRRIPLRVSQMLTPHSLLTRTLRTGRWAGMPGWVDEQIIRVIAGFSFATLVGGTVGIFARGRGWYAATAAAIVLYHVAAIACLAGLSRYRVPLEPLWMVFAGALLAQPRTAWTALRADWRLAAGCATTTAMLCILMARFLPAAWPRWGTW